MRKGSALALVLSLAASQAPARAADPPPAEVRRVAQEVLADRRFQRVLPSVEQEPNRRPRGGDPDGSPRSPGGSSRDSSGGGGGRPLSTAASSAWGPLATVFSALLWIVLACVLCLLAVASFRSVRERRRQERAGTVGIAEPEAAGPAPPDPLEIIDRLAGEGRHAEAVHALLLRAIGDVRSRGTTVLPDNLTSREVMDAAGLPPRPRDAFSTLVGAVEVAIFGRRPTDRAAYDAARARYLEFSTAFLRRSR